MQLWKTGRMAMRVHQPVEKVERSTATYIVAN